MGDAKKLGGRNWRNAARRGTAGGSFTRRPWLKMGCCANDEMMMMMVDDHDDTSYGKVFEMEAPHHYVTNIYVCQRSIIL
jgi:hypothetical protein